MTGNEQEISIIQLFRVAFGNKIRLISVTIALAALMMAYVLFVHDPGKAEYKSDFNYFVQGLDEGHYIDGSAFNFEQLVTLGALESAKAKEKAFASIDIATLYDENGIYVEHVRDEKITNSVSYVCYRIVAKKRYFKDEEQAKRFIATLAEAPIDKTLQLSDSNKYKYYLNAIDDCESFELQLSYLAEQLALLDARYEQLMDYYGDITLLDGSTLAGVKHRMDVFFVNNSLDYLRYEQEEKGYVLNRGQNVNNLKLTMLDLEKQKKYNEMELERLETSISALMGAVSSGIQSAEIDSYNSRITELIATNVSITKKIDDIELQLQNVDNKNNTVFGEKILSMKQELERYTDRYQEIEYEVVRDNSKVFYSQASVIEEQGGFGLIKGAVLAIVLGGFLAACVNVVKGWRSLFIDPFGVEQPKEEKTE